MNVIALLIFAALVVIVGELLLLLLCLDSIEREMTVVIALVRNRPIV